MKIQAAVQICLHEKTDLFARPLSWRGSGYAIDLGRKKDSSKVRKLRPLGTVGACLGAPWDIDPYELLGVWEIVTLEELRLEVP